MTETTVSTSEIDRRTIRRADWVPCKAAFIDCRTPGSDRKDNYSFIGVGVSQNADQFINLVEPHGFNMGAAGMPRDTINSLHLHFTAEVFINFGGDYLVRWGTDGLDGDFVSHDGDVITVPTWIFRGFTNVGDDEGILYTVLGRDDTGGIIWGPSVLKEAEGYGLHLKSDNSLIDTVAGDALPDESELIKPMEQIYIDELTQFSAEEMRARVVTEADRRYQRNALLCTAVEGGDCELALVIGYGITEHRRQVPPVHEPHGFALAWLRAEPGQGLLRHRHGGSQVFTAKKGRWLITLNEGGDEITRELGYLDALSVPAGAWRSAVCLSSEEGPGELLVVTQGDGRTELDWATEVVDAAHDAGWALDPNHYLAPVAVLRAAALDD